MINVTIGLTHDILHGKKKNDKYPVKIRITYLRERHYYRTGIDLTKAEWQEVFMPGRKHAENRQALFDLEERAKKIVAELPYFSFNAFGERFFSKRSTDTLASLLEEYEGILKKQNRIGTMDSCKCARMSLNAWKTIYLSDITPELFHEYEEWMLEKKRKLTTIGMYIRAVRTVLNMAIEKGTIKREQYPFGKRKYVIPTGRNVKKALTSEEMAKLINYKCKSDAEQEAMDYWLFSYYANGINFKDIALFQEKYIHGDVAIIERAKTINTTRSNPKPIKIYMLPELKEIIKRRGRMGKSYIFPIITSADAQRTSKEIKQFIKVTNSYMKDIGEKLKFQFPLTTYVARHSYATIMLNAGFDKYAVGNNMGHSNTKTTDSYFAGFSQEYLKKMAEKLRV